MSLAREIKESSEVLIVDQAKQLINNECEFLRLEYKIHFEESSDFGGLPARYVDIVPVGDKFADDHKKFGGIFLRCWNFGNPQRLTYGIFMGAERAEQSEPRRGVSYLRKRLGQLLLDFETKNGFGYHTWTSGNFPWSTKSSRAVARQLEQFITFREDNLEDERLSDIDDKICNALNFIDSTIHHLLPIRETGKAIIELYYGENLPRELEAENLTTTSEFETTPYCIDNILADGCFLPRSELERILRRLRDKKNLILQGPPGTGKTWLAKRLGMALIGQVVQEPQLRSVQFHPNLAYEDFVRGWRPSSNGSLTLHEGIFMEMVKSAMKKPDQTHVLVIEEINRGNPAQIFGELLTLLEAGKREPHDAMQLSYPDPDGTQRPVYVPENLAVIGTMNIADRSLALVDMAFRRRFAFINLEPCLGETWREWVVSKLQMDLVSASEIEQRLNKLNLAIASDRRLGKAFRIGHSYVTPTQSLEGRSSRDWFTEIVDSELKPLLEEYWFDAPEEAERQANALIEGW